MNIAQIEFHVDEWQTLATKGTINNSNVQLILIFAERKLLQKSNCVEKLISIYPNARIVSCSTSGEISNNLVLEDTIQGVIIEFKSTTICAESINYTQYMNGFEAGAALIKKLNPEKLSYILVLSDGSNVNGSDLTNGMNSVFMNKVPITGGLAADNTRFEETLVGLDNKYEKGQIVAIGFYGDKIQIGHSSLGGWDMFGPEKLVTKSENNILYELDNKNALDIYKEYLGTFSNDLPKSALLFPLAIQNNDEPNYVVRTILGVDEENKTMTFAGSIPQNAKARLMKANFNKLIEASSIAATTSLEMVQNPSLALLISCVGRKIILGPRVDEEVEAVREVLGEEPIITGFYSYGEISPFNPNGKCELHNQTMTITTFKEMV